MNNVENINEKLKAKYSGLKFNKEKHEYLLKTRKLTPATTAAKEFYQEFDAEYHSRRIAERDGLTQEEVLEKWKKIGTDAANYGTDVHDFGERYVQAVYYAEYLDIVPRNKKEEAVISFWKNLPSFLFPVATELRMYSEKYGIAGTLDFLLFDSITGKFIIGDYKTNEKLFDDYNLSMLPPFEYMPNNNYNLYQIQLSLYQIMLEDAGYQVSGRQLIWLKSDGKYKVFNTHDFTKMLRKHYENRRIYK